MTLLSTNIKHIDLEIDILRRENPLRIWDSFFEAFNSKMISAYKKHGKFKLLFFAQCTHSSLSKILYGLKEDYSFIDYDFIQSSGSLTLKNNKTNQFDSIYIGDQSVEAVIEVCDKFEKRDIEEKQKENGRLARLAKRKALLMTLSFDVIQA
jgi:hypothetical protein